jgi:hypothetical protein
MGLPHNNIDLANIVQENRMLLCNFQAAEDELIGLENTRVLGTLLLSELWESFRKRSKATEFHLLIDECHQFIGPDIQQILTEAAKYGLRLWLFHQHEGQIKDIAGAMKNAQTKLIFSTEESPKEQRHFTLRHPNHDTVDVLAPNIPDWHVSQAQVDAYVEYLTQYFMTSEEVDSALCSTQNEEEPNPYE